MDKIDICPLCKHEIEDWECEQCKKREEQKEDRDQNAINNYVDDLLELGDL